MLDRLVTAPDGVEWSVGRAFLFGPPRYIGFRFGRERRVAEPPRIRRVPVTARAPRSPTAVIAPIGHRSWPEDDDGRPTAPRRRQGAYHQQSGTIFLPSRRRRSSGLTWSTDSSSSSWSGGSSSSGSRSGSSSSSGSGSGSSSSSGSGGSSGMSFARSGGGGGRSFASVGTGFSRSDGGGSGESSKSGKGGGAAGGAAALFGALLKVAKVLLIVIAIAVATWLTIFVLIPGLIFALWSLLVGISIAWHTVFRRPWIIRATEMRPAPNTMSWAVEGWAESKRVIDEIADALAEGRPPRPVLATELVVPPDRQAA